MVRDESAIRSIVQSPRSVSDKIRDLNALGLSRSEIANRLGRRYQQVRNVLVNDHRRKGGSQASVAAPRLGAAGRERGAFGLVNLAVGSEGQLELPRYLLEALGAAAGERVVVEYGVDALKIVKADVAARRAQELVASIVPVDRDLVGELLAERHEAAQRGE